MPDTKEPVVFLLGDTGEEVSNDPRWFEEKMKAQFEKQNKATDGQFEAQLRAQIREEVMAEVRENYLAETENTGRATVSDQEAARQLGTGQTRGTFTGQDVQQPPMRVTVVDDQTNKGAGDDDDLDKPLDKMTADELKAEVAKMKEAGTEVDTSGVTKKSELVERIKAARGE